MLFRWWRRNRELLSLAESLERQCERLRNENRRLLMLVRALRDVNVDLDTKLLHGGDDESFDSAHV
jgi:hypothetical protein